MSQRLKPSIKSVREASLLVEAQSASPAATADFVAPVSASHVVSSSMKTYRLADRGRVEIRNLNRILQNRGEPAAISMSLPADSLTD